MAVVELILCHRYATGSIEVWLQSAPGWVTLTLPSPMRVQAALEWWADAIADLSGYPCTWTWTAGVTLLVSSDDPVRVRMHASLAELLGWASADNGAFYEEWPSTAPCLGLVELPVGFTVPLDRESAELDELRGGRAVALTYGRALECEIETFWTPAQWATYSGHTLASGHGARFISGLPEMVTEDSLDGIVYPLQTLEVLEEGVDSVVRVTTRCSVRDPGDLTSVSARTTWGEMLEAVRYGYAPFYELRVDGLPVRPVELVRDLEAPEGLELDASLVVDRTARLGPSIEESTHLAKAFDLSAQLLDTPAIRALARAPSAVTTLTADVGVADTAWSVARPDLFEVGQIIYLGVECAEVTAVGATSVTVTRGLWGRARSHVAGVEVTDAPLVWEGRGVQLVLRLLDPCGRYVSATCVIWQGDVLSPLDRDGAFWVLPCRDQVRRLHDPLGVAAAGTATWTLDDDSLQSVDVNLVLTLDIEVEDGPVVAMVVRPFVGQPYRLRPSKIRELIATAIEAAYAPYLPWVSGSLSRPRWRLGRGPFGNRRYELMVDATSISADAWDVRVRHGLEGVGNSLSLFSSNLHNDAGLFISAIGVSGGTAEAMLGLALSVPTISGISLRVELDDVAGSDLPAAGWVRLEGDGVDVRKRYRALEVDPLDPQAVTLELEPESTPSGEELRLILESETAAGRALSLTASFFWADQGPIEDVLRRALQSSGDEVNGTYDVLARGQGLDLATVDEGSFTVFDGAFRGMSFDVTTDGGTKFAELFGGLLRLSRRALTTRRATDGGACEIAAVRVGPIEGGVPVASLTASHLVSAQTRPCRPLKTLMAPHTIKVALLTLDEAAAGSMVFKGRLARYRTKAIWDLEVYGIDRATLYPAAAAWAEGWTRAPQRQGFELDVDPTCEAQVGDLVWVDIHDPQLWQWTLGVPGYTGWARVLGCLFNLQLGILTLQLEGGGALPSAPLCPSVPIVAVQGTDTSPTAIDVPLEYLPLLERARNGGAWRMLAYRPGQDSGRGEYLLGALTETGGVCRLTVTSAPSSPTISLSTAYRLTYPVEADCTATQAVHVHGLDGLPWY